MSNYTKATNFTAKDGLPSGNPGKIIKGTEIDTELTAIASAISSKADTNSPSLTGTATAPTAALGTNTTQLANTAFVQAALSALIPTGVITLWSGSIASIPSGWALCNGSNGTPDLRDRFVVGAGTTYAVGATGGSATSTLTTNELPAHTHSLSASGTTAASGDHTHSFSGTTSTQSADHVHSGTTATAGTHTHTESAVDNFDGSQTLIGGSTPIGGYRQTSSAGAHNHTFTTGGVSANHTHDFSGVTSAVSATHTHSVTVTGTSGSTGSGAAFTNLPPYYALAYIMKL